MTNQYKRKRNKEAQTRFDGAWEHTVRCNGSKSFVARLYRVAGSTVARMRETLAVLKAAYPETWEAVIKGKSWLECLHTAEDIGAPENESPKQREIRLLQERLEKTLGKRPESTLLAEAFLNQFPIVCQEINRLQTQKLYERVGTWT